MAFRLIFLGNIWVMGRMMSEKRKDYFYLNYFEAFPLHLREQISTFDFRYGLNLLNKPEKMNEFNGKALY